MRGLNTGELNLEDLLSINDINIIFKKDGNGFVVNYTETYTET
jgi:hypothetical protein